MPAALGRNFTSPSKRSTKHNNAVIVGRLPYARLPKNGDNTRPTGGGKTLLEQLQRQSDHQSLRSRNELNRLNNESTALSSIPTHDPRLRLNPKEWPRNTAAGIMAAWRELCRRQELILREKKELGSAKDDPEKPPTSTQKITKASPSIREANDSTVVVPGTYKSFVWKSDARLDPSLRGSPKATKDAKPKARLSSRQNGSHLPFDERQSKSREPMLSERTLVLRSRSVSREAPPPTPRRSHRMKGSSISASSTLKKRQLSTSPCHMEVQKKSRVTDTDNTPTYPKRAINSSNVVHSDQHPHDTITISKERRKRAGCFSAVDEDLDDEFGPMEEDLDLMPRRPRFENKKSNMSASYKPVERISYNFFKPRVPPLREMEEVGLYKKQVEEENQKAAKALKVLEEKEAARLVERQRAQTASAEALKPTREEIEQSPLMTPAFGGPMSHPGILKPKFEISSQPFTTPTSLRNPSSNISKTAEVESNTLQFSFKPPSSPASTQDKYTLPAFTFNKGGLTNSSNTPDEKGLVAPNTEPKDGQSQTTLINGFDSKLPKDNIIHRETSSTNEVPKSLTFPTSGQKTGNHVSTETSVQSTSTKPSDSDMDFGDAPELDSNRAPIAGKSDMPTAGRLSIDRALSVPDDSKDKTPVFSFGQKRTLDNTIANSTGFSFQKLAESPFNQNGPKNTENVGSNSTGFSFQKPSGSSLEQMTPNGMTSSAFASSSTGNAPLFSFTGKSVTNPVSDLSPFSKSLSGGTASGSISPPPLSFNPVNAPQAPPSNSEFSFGGPSNTDSGTGSGFSFTSGIPSPSFAPTPPSEGQAAFNIGVNNSQVRNRPMAQPRSRRTARR